MDDLISQLVTIVYQVQGGVICALDFLQDLVRYLTMQGVQSHPLVMNAQDPVVLPPAPQGDFWRAIYDAKTGTYFYENARTGEVRWTPPGFESAPAATTEVSFWTNITNDLTVTFGENWFIEAAIAVSIICFTLISGAIAYEIMTKDSYLIWISSEISSFTSLISNMFTQIWAEMMTP